MSMTANSEPVAVCEWALSGFGDEISADPVVQCAVLLALGARHIEVRSAWDVNVVDLSAHQLGDLRRVIDEAGLGVSAIASPIGKVDIGVSVASEVERLERVLDAAETLGTTYVRIFSFYPGERDPDSIRDGVMERMIALTNAAASRGITLLHENEKHIFGDIPRRVVDILQTVNSPFLRAAWDSANFVQVGVRPYAEAFESIAPYIEYLQIKDALMKTAEVVPAGAGDGDIPRVVQALRESGYTGFVSLEPHLSAAFSTGGFSGPESFGVAARAFAEIAAAERVVLR